MQLLWLVGSLGLALATCAQAQDTRVRFDTSLGQFDVRLFDEVAPVTVANFLNYVADSDYDDSIVHRSVPGFVIQGGGFYADFETIPADPPIQNEFDVSNTRGTIAMAKLGGNPNSATSQWFINLTDNSSNLDHQNGGFAVFGEVVGDGLEIVDMIAALDTAAFGFWSDIPVIDSSLPPPDLTAPPNLVVIHSVGVVPEPSSCYLLLCGLALFAWRRKPSRSREE